MGNQHFSIIFDTNILYNNYDKKADFTEFYFNTTFNNILDKIEEKDICSFIDVIIPEIVWSELKKHKIEKYEEKKEDYKSKILKFKFPNIEINIGEDIDYEEYLNKKMNQYKEKINNRQVKIKELKFPDNNRLPSIIDRACNKKPPFGGKEKNSDKGFKDVLLWESIIEYKENNENEKIILYTNDNIFNSEIEEEFKQLFNNDEIVIVRNELEILNVLDKILNINIPDGINVKDIEKKEYEDVLNYIHSKKFSLEVVEKLNDINILSDTLVIEDFRVVDLLNIIYEETKNNKEDIYNIRIKGNIYINKYAGDIEDIFEQERIFNLVIKKCKEDIRIENIEMEPNN